MSKILLFRVFHVDKQRITLAAGIKNGKARVVLGLPDAAGLSELANITIEYKMRTPLRAVTFVQNATCKVIERGLEKYRDEVSDLAERLNRALSEPYKPVVSYTRRGDVKKPGR